MSTTKWIPGVTMIQRQGGVAVPFIKAADDGQATLEAEGWRAVDQPVDVPAEKRVPALAPGWSTSEGGFCHDCHGGALGWLALRYERPSGMGGIDGYCEVHAAKHGAFAPPAPAKTGCPVWCGGPSRDCHTFEHVCHSRLGEPCACSYECADAVRAKPAEPKPAPTYSTSYASACADEAFGPPTTIKKPAPAEKATVVIDEAATWLPQIEETAVKEVFPGSYAEWAALQTGVAPGLEREKRAINVRGVRSIYLPTAESQGEKLSRLVESGVKAGALVDASTWQARFDAATKAKP